MVGFLIEENSQYPVQDSLSIEDFCESLLDFDTLSDWTEVDQAMDHVAGLDLKVGDLRADLEKDDSFVKLGDLGSLIEEDKAMDGVAGLDLKLEKGEKLRDMGTNLGVKLGDLGSLIEEDMGKVKIVEAGDRSLSVGVESEKEESDGSSSESESESSSSSDSSSSSEEEDDSDDEEEEVKEEGEINDSDVEKMVAWSEDELEDEDGGVRKGPIQSKNELKDLPPVPPVDVSLQPHHHPVPVGVVSSVLGAQVIVEGVEQHNPLNEGTIFWITETRTPLGLVDEIFGPVKSPFYIIRYNSEDEVPEGIKQGTCISFVPEFANHVLNDNLYKKGYDASGDNDEEISDEYEFSDDEKEAEFKKLQKMKKRGTTNEANSGNEFKGRKNLRNRGGGSSQQNQFSRNCGGSLQNNVLPNNSSGLDQNQQYGTPVATSANNANYLNPVNVGQNYGNAPSLIPQFQQNVAAPGFIPPPNVVWTNGMPGQQGMVFPNSMMWPQQNMLPTGVPFPQQFASNNNGVLPMAQQNFPGAPSFGPWQGPFAQSGMNQQFGVAMPMNMNGQQCPPPMSNTEMPREFNQGAYGGRGGRGGRGRGPHHRGGSRFRGGRGPPTK